MGKVVEKQTMVVDAVVDNVPVVTEFVNKILKKYQCPSNVEAIMDIAIDELFSNIAFYGYPADRGKAEIMVSITEEPQSVVITFKDGGIPYNPLEKKDPDITLSAEERQIGGLGVYMVKQSMDEVSYCFENGNNILTIQKQF